MSVYMVERDLPGVSLADLAAAQQAAIETSRRLDGNGRSIRYIRSTWVPGDSRVMCLFEADSEGSVRDVNQQARIPFTRIVEALDLTP